MRKPWIIGAVLAAVHLAAVLLVARHAGDGADLAKAQYWTLFLAFDFPVSMGWVVLGWLVAALRLPVASAEVANVWVPAVYLGVAGTAWWLVLPRLAVHLADRERARLRDQSSSMGTSS